MPNNVNTKITSKVEGKDLVLERTFDAPRELVFQAFSKAEHLEKWWSTEGWSTPVCNVDFRPGGVWQYCMKCTDENQEEYGMESWGKAVYQDIQEPEKIVLIDSFSDAEGNILEDMPSTKMTLTFIEQDGKTKLVSRSEYPTAEELQAVLDMGVLEGVTQTWDKLASLLEELQK
ncbi:SRPBCC domain-containing protein [Gracilibacillus dipsosauri]|uniref:ATPase n=1 Tax=Gracilibacillus dipsosauri TaxID=178340 RepID=A0A317KVX1_9BACI|nr:SRPBCC domain-containing protein [Gracilibacillus dipsosauri]PWU67433.1 ATPase [Gracilibacillus dipsosauri]